MNKIISSSSISIVVLYIIIYIYYYYNDMPIFSEIKNIIIKIKNKSVNKTNVTQTSYTDDLQYGRAIVPNEKLLIKNIHINKCLVPNVDVIVNGVIMGGDYVMANCDSDSLAFPMHEFIYDNNTFIHLGDKSKSKCINTNDIPIDGNGIKNKLKQGQCGYNDKKMTLQKLNDGCISIVVDSDMCISHGNINYDKNYLYGIKECDENDIMQHFLIVQKNNVKNIELNIPRNITDELKINVPFNLVIPHYGNMCINKSDGIFKNNCNTFKDNLMIKDIKSGNLCTMSSNLQTILGIQLDNNILLFRKTIGGYHIIVNYETKRGFLKFSGGNIIIEYDVVKIYSDNCIFRLEYVK